MSHKLTIWIRNFEKFGIQMIGIQTPTAYESEKAQFTAPVMLRPRQLPEVNHIQSLYIRST